MGLQKNISRKRSRQNNDEWGRDPRRDQRRNKKQWRNAYTEQTRSKWEYAYE